ncbi:fibronectin type III-like domain-contianing protein [Paenarthrobacter sp. YIM B13468]|uniref:fibronectin type III-like domain-contianing protein n=1 Tax=Paenarthrobacter sp. YIM B13468 TaxID=3366295 RepID=UPI0036711E9D
MHATVTNIGDRAGKHVVQVYVATAAGPVRRPARELRAFTKIDLQAGESRQVALTLDRRAFAYWDIELDRWVVPAGGYTIQVCADASTVLAEQEVTLAGDSIIRELTMDSTVGDWFAHPAVGPALMVGLTASMTEEQAKQAQENNDQLKMVESMPMQQFLAFTNGAFPPEALQSLMELSRKETAA